MSTLGITNDLRDVNLLTFRPTPERPINLAILSEVKLEFYKVKEDTKKMRDYIGKEVPSLVLHFQSPASKNPLDKVHHYIHRFFMVEQTNNDKERIEYTKMFQALKHIYSTFAQFPEAGIEVNDARVKSVKQTDGTIVSEPIQASPEAMIDMFTKFFTKVVALFNTGRDGKPVYQDDKGTFIPVWLKLVISYGGDKLVLPDFPGEGYIERAIMTANGFAPTSLELAIIKGEKESVVKQARTRQIVVPGSNAGSAGADDLPPALM